MKHSSSLWSWYLAIVLVTGIGMIWISMASFRWVHDRQVSQDAVRIALIETQKAKAELERQQRIGEGLWYADSILGPILFNESEQPHQNYVAFWDTQNNRPFENFPVPTPIEKPPEYTAISPLLLQPSTFALLHFQYDAAGRWRSPQVPPPSALEFLEGLGVATEPLAVYQTRLQELQTISVPQLMVSIGLPELNTIANAAVSNAANSLGPNANGNLRNRAQTLNAYATNSSLQQQYNAIQSNYNDPSNSLLAQPPQPQPNIELLPSSHAIWLEEKLLLLKRVQTPMGAQIQGCWLDWDRLRGWMTEQLADTLPGVEFEPVATAMKSTPSPQQLASLPVRLKWDFPVDEKPRDFSEIENSLENRSASQWLRVLVLPLSVAWISWFLGAVGAAGLLLGVWRLSQRRATFVSAVTHELRTPLTTFRLYTDLLLSRKDLQESQREHYLRTLNTQSDRLARLVENVLAFSKLDGKGHALPLQEVSIERLLSFVQPRFHELGQRYQATIDVSVSNEAKGCGLRIHEDMFEQMITNLVENACKYGLTTDQRKVSVECRILNKRIEFDVTDRGPGIAAEFQNKLFQPFSRSAEQAAGKSPGIGLGLSIVHRMAKQLRGRLEWIRGTPGETRFRLSFPCRGSSRTKEGT